MTYYALAESQEPALREIHHEIKKRLLDLEWVVVENLATITIELNVRRKQQPNATGKNGSNGE